MNANVFKPGDLVKITSNDRGKWILWEKKDEPTRIRPNTVFTIVEVCSGVSTHIKEWVPLLMETDQSTMNYPVAEEYWEEQAKLFVKVVRKKRTAWVHKSIIEPVEEKVIEPVEEKSELQNLFEKVAPWENIEPYKELLEKSK